MAKQYGKGSSRRQEDARKVRENWDGIKGFKQRKRELRERDEESEQEQDTAKN
jgi:hypothetical protein